MVAKIKYQCVSDLRDIQFQRFAKGRIKEKNLNVSDPFSSAHSTNKKTNKQKKRF